MCARIRYRKPSSRISSPWTFTQHLGGVRGNSFQVLCSVPSHVQLPPVYMKVIHADMNTHTCRYMSICAHYTCIYLQLTHIQAHTLIHIFILTFTPTDIYIHVHGIWFPIRLRALGLSNMWFPLHYNSIYIHTEAYMHAQGVWLPVPGFEL